MRDRQLRYPRHNKAGMALLLRADSPRQLQLWLARALPQNLHRLTR